MSLILAWMLGCTDRPDDPAARRPPACLAESEGAVLARHLAALDGLAWLAAGEAARRPLGFAALAGAAPLGPVALQGACTGFDTGASCEDDEACWSTRCEAFGWSAHASPPLQADPDWSFDGVGVTVQWTAQSPEALACTAEATASDGRGTDWSVRQHLTFSDGQVAVAETYTGLRPGWEVLLRAAGGIGSVTAEGHLLATLQGHAVRPACDP
jgi:hypothetical protein